MTGVTLHGVVFLEGGGSEQVGEGGLLLLSGLPPEEEHQPRVLPVQLRDDLQPKCSTWC